MPKLSAFEVNKRIVQLIVREFPVVMLAIGVVYFISTAGGYATSYLSGRFVDVLADPGASPWRNLELLIGLYAITSIAIAVAGSLSSYLQFRLRFRTQQFVWNSLYAATARLDLGQIEDPAVKDLTQKINDNAFEIFNYVMRITWISWSIFSLGIGGAILGSYAWWVPLVIVVCSLPVYLVEKTTGMRAWGISGSTAEDRRRYATYSNHFSDTMSFAQLKLLNASDFFLEKLNALQERNFTLSEKNQRESFIKTSAISIFLWIPYTLIITYFIHRVLLGAISPGRFVFVLGSIFSVSSAASNLLTHIGDQMGSFAYVRDYLSFLALPPVLPRIKSPIALPYKTPRIEFQNVSFSYPGSKTAILQNVSFTIEPGEKVALIGVNGAGKTTLVKLLARFYDPTEGTIRIDGTDLRQIELSSWHAQIGILFQDFARYRFHVDESIRTGRNEHEDADVVTAARKSGADSFIRAWRSGYHQQLGREFKGGVEPSVGQWQKIAIAQMFFRDPLLYVLDEPTASIDAQAESEIFREFDALPKSTSVLMISHRFSTVRNADKIIVLKSGAVSELGSHRELMEKDGTYAQLFRLQAAGYAN